MRQKVTQGFDRNPELLLRPGGDMRRNGHHLLGNLDDETPSRRIRVFGGGLPDVFPKFSGIQRTFGDPARPPRGRNHHRPAILKELLGNLDRAARLEFSLPLLRPGGERVSQFRFGITLQAGLDAERIGGVGQRKNEA